MNMLAEGWTEERVADLTRLWSEGYSASQIANELGGITRNSVISKVHRLKLERGAPSVSELPKIARDRGADTRGNGSLARKIGQAKEAGAATLSDVLRKQEAPLQPVIRDEDIVPIPLDALTNTSCRWPLGEPSEAGFGFCGQPIVDGKSIYEHESYCARHKRRATAR